VVVHKGATKLSEECFW